MTRSMGDGESNDLIGTTLGKKFLVRRLIGSGGMGAVYEVEHVLTKRVGALKLLHAHVAGSGRIVERFVREASAAGRIGNPHIVETIDAGELPSGEPYMFMELLSGESVSDLLKRRGRLGFDEARAIVLQAAEGLAAAHAAGIVHRDVKPENLFLCRGEAAYVKLLDFGISKFEAPTEHRLTAEGVPMGTPYYMSPEQVAGKSDIGPASDVYSLGVVLYECVTGSVPYDASTLPALSIKIFEGNYEPPSSVLGAAAQGLDEVIARAMATAPSRRYASMAEFGAALEMLGPSSPLSLQDTLARTAVELDVTAEAAPPSHTPAAEATTERPRSAEAPTPPDSSAVTPNSRPKRAARPVVIALGAATLAIAAAAALARSGAPKLEQPTVSGSENHQSASASTAHPLPVAPDVPTVTTAASATPPAVPKPRAPLARSAPTSPTTPPASKAARDGLSEQNPFAE